MLEGCGAAPARSCGVKEERREIHTQKGGKKEKPARTTQRPRAGITNSNLKKTSRARRGARRRRRCPGAGRGRAGGSWLLPPVRGGDPSPGPFPTWDSPCAAQPDPRGGFCCLLAAGRAAGVCVGGERVILDGVGEETKGFFRGRGARGGGSEFRQRLPGAEGKPWLRRGVSAGCGVKESKGTVTL